MNPMPYPETINAKEPTLFGCPVQITLRATTDEVVDVTHALQWDGEDVTLDLHAVTKALAAAQARWSGRSIGEGEG